MIAFIRKIIELWHLNKLWERLCATIPKDQRVGWAGVHEITGTEVKGEDEAMRAAELIFNWAEHRELDYDWVMLTHQGVLACSVILHQEIIWAADGDTPNRIRYYANYHYIDFILE